MGKATQQKVKSTMTEALLVSALALALSLGAGGVATGDHVSNTVSKMIETELGVFVYPKGDQDASTQANDSLKCYDSAKERTGIDPKAPPAEVQAAKPKRGGAVKGAAGGAARGAAVGAIFDDAAKGAEAGAVAGAMRGRRAHRREAAQAQEQAKETAAATEKERLSTFNRAFGACMDARNYSVQ